MTDIERIQRLLKKHEGLRLHPYHCSEGKLTIGYGRNLESIGISEKEAVYLLNNDIIRVHNECQRFPWFSGLSHVRKAAIIDMAFNMGTDSVAEFKDMILCIEERNFMGAGLEMIDSKWAKQVGNRAKELAYLMGKDQFLED